MKFTPLPDGSGPRFGVRARSVLNGGTPRWVLAAALLLGASGCDDAADPTAEVPALAPADVSFLLPISGAAALSATTEGGHGVLLPRAVVDLAEALTRVDEPDDLYTALRVVGVRLDPCFVEGRGGEPCASQVRLVLQPVFADGAGAVARDAALHAFYAVPPAELAALAAALRDARLAIEGDAAPGIVADPAAAVALVRAQVGAARLTRMTFMAVHASDEAWTFGGFDLAADGSAAPMAIPGVDEPEQHLTSTGGTEALDETILPSPTIETALPPFLAALTRADMDAEGSTAALDGLRRLMSPVAHNPGTVDCATCHVATGALRYATRADAPDEVPAAYDDTRNQRMFGWFGSTPSVSPRVLAETQAVLEAMKTLEAQ